MKTGKRILLTTGLLAFTIFLMGLFPFFRKAKAETTPAVSVTGGAGPYKDSTANLFYHLLFCDDPGLFNNQVQPPYPYPFDRLFQEPADAPALGKVAADLTLESRLRLLAFRRLGRMGEKISSKELLGVVVEVGLPGGLDVLASFSDGTARYINQTGRMLIWETTTDSTANALNAGLFAQSHGIVWQIGPWDKPRRPHPPAGTVRISFLVADGLYFGEGPLHVLFGDALAGPALEAATRLMQYLTQQVK